MNKILDPGHRYELLTLDGETRQTLTFVKRFDPDHPEKFPGNRSRHAGTTLQSVLQCLCNRVRYLNNQIPCMENEIILRNLQESIFLLESRAAKRHGLNFPNGPMTMDSLEFSTLCPKCGHTTCEHRDFPS